MYATPIAFRNAMEDRIRAIARVTGKPHNSIRQRVLFERALERIHVGLADSFIVKGGLALELRIDRARTTRDIDLRVEGDLAKTIERIRSALNGPREGDAAGLPERFLGFVVIGQHRLEVVKDYAAMRLEVEARVGGKLYGGRFHIDIATGDVLTGPPEFLERPSFFEFVGVKATRYALYPVVTHLAEKVHALTLPRTNDNSRLKDLIDVALLLELATNSDDLVKGLKTTFHHRATHELPRRLPEFPSAWTSRYPNERKRDFPWLPWTTLAEIEERVRRDVDRLLERCWAV
jgi:hypothetical protein